MTARGRLRRLRRACSRMTTLRRLSARTARSVTSMRTRASLSASSFHANGDRASAVEEANASLDETFGLGGVRVGGGGDDAAPTGRLTHVDERSGAASMVNVGSKPSTSREATASARVWLGAEAFALVRENRMKKGDVLATARIAGIMGAKKTHDLIPLCHAIAIDAVKVDLTLNESERAVDIVAVASCTGKTGVEMEALTAAAVSGLTIYDMCKAVSKDIVVACARGFARRHGVGDDGAFVLELNIYLRAIRTRVRSAVIYSRSHPTPRASMAKAPPPQNAPAEPS